VPAFAKMLHAACVTARRHGNLIEKDEITSLPAGRRKVSLTMTISQIGICAPILLFDFFGKGILLLID
jgi:hypothetical protein